MASDNWIVPDWPAPANVRAVCSTRNGGVSVAPYASMNPADHVGDDPAAVATNRERLQQSLTLPGSPVWLRQVHGNSVVDAANTAPAPEADAAYSHSAGVVCAVLTADCLPVLLCDRAGSMVAVAHAGWCGLAAGVIEQTVQAAGLADKPVLAWLGPAIGPAAYVVGDEVRDSFIAHDAQAESAFKPAATGGWHADLYQLARQRLNACGIHAVSGGGWCTRTDQDRFFSYRRDGVTGRMATMIWLDSVATATAG